MTTPARSDDRGSAAGAIALVVDLAGPLATYYGLRLLGVGIYRSLIAAALASGFGAALRLIRNRRVDRLGLYVTTTMVISLGVSIVAGSPRFLLAKEGWLTGLTGVWFLLSARSRRPLTFSFSRPLLEGRLRWPDDWDGLWERLPRFRRAWRVSSVMWGVGTLLDAGLRVVMAYTLPIDVVPALGTALYAATGLVLIVLTNVYYLVSGVADRRSALYEPLRAASAPST